MGVKLAIAKKLQESTIHFTKAAEQQNIDAKYNLALCKFTDNDTKIQVRLFVSFIQFWIKNISSISKKVFNGRGLNFKIPFLRCYTRNVLVPSICVSMIRKR